MKPQGSPPPRKFGDFRGADEGKGDFKEIKGRSRWAAFGSLREWFGWRFIVANCLDDFRVSNSEMPIWSWIKHLDQKSRNSGEFISKFSKFIRDGEVREMGLSENGVYPQWNSHLIGIMISKTIGFRGTNHFQTHPNGCRNGCRWTLGSRRCATGPRGAEVHPALSSGGSGFSGSLVWGILDNQLQGLNGDNILYVDICWSTQS